MALLQDIPPQQCDQVHQLVQAEQLTKVLQEHVPGFENCFISHIAPTLGVRETRRFKGMRQLTGDMLLGGIIEEDTIGLGAYKIDIHSGTDRNTVFKTVKKPFGIPYGIMVSPQVNNLMFAGRCAGMDADALAAVRVMPQCMSMGHAAGIAAAMALTDKITPAQVDVQKLRQALLSQGAIIGMEQVK